MDLRQSNRPAPECPELFTAFAISAAMCTLSSSSFLLVKIAARRFEP
jgi:hypothetical protein